MTLQSDFPTKVLKQNSDYFAEHFYENINQCVSKSIFPSNLKLSDVIPVYKRKSKNSKDNYRPVGILFNISKIYERWSMIKFSSFSVLYCTNINAGFVFGVPQGSILGPLFNNFICDMFYFLGDFDIANYLDDSTPYCVCKSAVFLSVIQNNHQQFLFNGSTITTCK